MVKFIRAQNRLMLNGVRNTDSNGLVKKFHKCGLKKTPNKISLISHKYFVY